MSTNTLEQKYDQIKDENISLAEKIKTVFQGHEDVFDLKTLYKVFKYEKKTTLRGRVYRELLKRGELERVDEGVYRFKNAESEGVIVQGDARKMEGVKKESVELIVADHPYKIKQGTNRSFNSNYKDSTFSYRQEDFNEKARVLKDGCFLVEFLPSVKEGNWEYMNGILEMAKNAGLNLYLSTNWYKAEVRDGKLVDQSAFVGRQAVTESVFIFYKGKKPRKLRKRKQGQNVRMEAGAASMFPAVLMYPTLSPSKRAHKAQKPADLLEFLLKTLSLPGEFVVDQFAGSLELFFKAVEMGRRCLALELDGNIIEKSLEWHRDRKAA